MADCSQLAKNMTDIAMIFSQEEGVNTLDDIVAKMQELFPDLRRQTLVDYMVEATSRQKQNAEEISKDLKILKEARIDKALRDKIADMDRYIESGELPKRRQQQKQTDAVEELRSVLADLRRQLSRSEPARKERLEQSIAALEEKLKSGDIQPKPRTEVAQSKALDDLVYKRDLLRQEIREEIKNTKPMTLWEKAGAVLDFPRLLMTTGEFSFGLRQGGVYFFSHPVRWVKAMETAFQAFKSSRALYDINKAIFTRENAPLYMKAKLPLLYEGMSLSKQEEIIMNYWMDKLPVIRNFNRAAIAFFNTMRTDIFDMGYKTLGQTEGMTQEEAKIWSNYISVMSGRSSLGKFESATLALNRTFFSVRYVISRFQLLTGQPLWHQAGNGSWRVRKMIAKEYARLGMGLLTIFALGMLSGADIEEDPTSSDFGKLRFGRRRLDPLMGIQQVAVFMARLITGKTKTIAGEVRPLRGPDVQYGSRDVQDVIADFGRSKLSPQFGFMMNLLTGETMTGEEIDLMNTAGQLAYPMTYADIYEAMQEDGIPTSTALSILALLGMGLQTYQDEGRYAKKRERGLW